MEVETAEDRLSLLEDFGVQLSYSQRSRPAVPILSLFDRQHQAVDTENGSVSAFAVTATCRSDDLARLPAGKALQGDRIWIGRQSWDVADVQPDGTGFVILILRKP